MSAEDFRLGVQTHIADLVEKGLFPHRQASIYQQYDDISACERAPLIPEQFAFKETIRKSRAVYCYEWFCVSCAVAVNVLGGKLLTSSCLSRNEHMAVSHAPLYAGKF